jgi:hypothetical protein
MEKKERLRKHYLTMFLREALSVFEEIHPAVSLWLFNILSPSTRQCIFIKENTARPMQV